MQYQCAVIGCKLKQNANEGCNSCASLAGLVLSFTACFTLLVIAPLLSATVRHTYKFHLLTLEASIANCAAVFPLQAYI